MCYRPSGRRSVRQQFTSISSYTIDARITKPICMIPLCIQTYLKYFYYFQFWNNSDFSDFTQKCNFSGNLSQNLSKFWSVYTSYIKRVLLCDFQITSENGNIDGGGGFWRSINATYSWRVLLQDFHALGASGGFWKKIVCYFSLPASPPTLLMLESPNLYSWYPYIYRWWQHIWNFSTSSSFEKKSDFSDFTKMQFLWEFITKLIQIF